MDCAFFRLFLKLKRAHPVCPFKKHSPLLEIQFQHGCDDEEIR